MGKQDKNKPKRAAGLFSITDDCMVPGRSIKLLYRGPDPASIATKLTSSFQPFFRISSAGWGEPDFRWDISGEPATFFIKWWVRKTFSRYSAMLLHLSVQGDENSQTKKGKFTLELTPVLTTQIPEHWFLRGIFMVYNYLFYDNVRQNYIKECRNLTIAYQEHMKTEFNLSPGSHKTSVDVHRL